MVKGLYTAYTGMINEQYRLDVVANNLANAATVGYKKESVSNQSFDDVLAVKVNDETVGNLNQRIGSMSLGVKFGENYTDYSQGSLHQTGNTFDLAIQGKGFFRVAVQNKNGSESIKYSRDGSFTVTSEGYVTDADGNRLMGEDGYIQVPTNAGEVSIDASGNIYSDGEYVNRITLADFEDYNYLEKYADDLYQTVDGATEIDSSGSILQGYTEQSNVSTVKEMVDMISITRAYEANQKVITTVDTMLDKAVNQVGKL